MATAFTNAFNANLKLAVPSMALPAINAIQNPTVPEIPAANLPTVPFSAWDSMSPEMQAKYRPVVDTSGITSASTSTVASRGDNSSWNANMGSTYNVTVNAGIGTDGANVGRNLVQILKQYERNNGAVWQAV
jgi:hypothetical protein